MAPAAPGDGIDIWEVVHAHGIAADGTEVAPGLLGGWLLSKGRMMVVGIVEYERQIAKISSTHLGYEGHSILTAMVMVEYGDSGEQGFGNYDLRPDNGAACARFIDGVLKACGVQQWEHLKGRTIYVLLKDRLIHGIEPLPTEPGEQFIFSTIMEN